MGDGADSILAEATANAQSGDATAIGILGGAIEAGSGDDSITGRSNELLVGDNGVALSGGRGLGGNVQIDMGAGDDELTGFGDAIVSGGAGNDTMILEFALQDFLAGGGELVAGNAQDLALDLSFAGEVLQTDGFEAFRFVGDTLVETFVYDDLVLV